MEFKVCSCCGKEKDIDKFSWKNKNLGKYQSQCKECIKKRDSEIYFENEDRRNKIRERATLQSKNNREFIRRYKQFLSCVKCSDNRWYVLDFHHKFDKNIEISSMASAGYSLTNIKNELRKCEALCANCHREEHFLNNWGRD